MFIGEERFIAGYSLFVLHMEFFLVCCVGFFFSAWSIWIRPKSGGRNTLPTTGNI